MNEDINVITPIIKTGTNRNGRKYGDEFLLDLTKSINILPPITFDREEENNE